MSRRDDWVFTYEANVLMDSAKQQADYHRERHQFWNREESAAEADLKAKGLTLRDFAVTGGARIEAVVDQSIGNRYYEAKRKREDHEHRLAEYERWMRALAGVTTRTELTLDIEDVAFFGL